MTIDELERFLAKKPCFYTRKETDEILRNTGKKVKVNSLPEVGVENYLYLIPTLLEDVYEQFVWDGTQFISMGNGKQDLTEYVTDEELELAVTNLEIIITNYCPIIEDNRNTNSAAIIANAPFKTLKGGLKILLHLIYPTKDNPTLDLILADGTTHTQPKSIVYLADNGNELLVPVSDTYGKFKARLYVFMVYELSGDRWVCATPTDKNTTYPTITESEIETGTNTEPKVVTPKILHDNLVRKRTVLNETSATVTLNPNKYHIWGSTDAITINLPRNMITPNSVNVVVSGTPNTTNVQDVTDYFDLYLSDYEDFGLYEEPEYYNAELSKKLDITTAYNMLLELESNGGNEATYVIPSDSPFDIMDMVTYFGLTFEDYNGDGSNGPSYYISIYEPTDEFLFKFTCASNNTTLTLPDNVSYGNGLNFETDKAANRTFQIKILDDIVTYTYV